MSDVRIKCDFCGGTGKLKKAPKDSWGLYRDCPRCDGTGHKWITKETAEHEILQDQINKLRRGE